MNEETEGWREGGAQRGEQGHRAAGGGRFGWSRVDGWREGEEEHPSSSMDWMDGGGRKRCCRDSRNSRLASSANELVILNLFSVQ